MSGDPAKAPARTFLETRKHDQKQCRISPCLKIITLRSGKKVLPPCVVCVHEGEVRRALK